VTGCRNTLVAGSPVSTCSEATKDHKDHDHEQDDSYSSGRVVAPIYYGSTAVVRPEVPKSKPRPIDSEHMQLLFFCGPLRKMFTVFIRQLRS
jgi:hypothetical protein